MTVYTEIFGGNTLYPAEPSFLSLTFSSNVTLEWPIEQAVGGDGIVAKIIELHPSGAGLSVTLGDATLVSTGYAVQFYNAEANTVTIRDDGGNSILTVASGTSWTLYLRDNSTANGLWRSYQAGAGTSTTNAASLAGAGLKAITTTLNADMPPDTHAVNYVILDADRANPQVWTGGIGDFTLPNPATVGTGWFVPIANQGSGTVTVTPAAGTIDQSGSLALAVGESAICVSDGTNYFTVGLGQAVNSQFDFISLNVAGTGDYTLSGAELNRIAYEFTGLLTGNRNIIVPSAIQQYWVDNQTSGAFSLTVKTAAGAGVTVVQGTRNILYCDGTDVLTATTFEGTTFADGSAAAPSITFSNNTTTGLFNSSGALGVATNGVQRAIADTTGHWTFAAPSSGTTPTVTVTGNNANVGVLTVTSGFNLAAATPGFAVRSTAVGGFATISICGGSNTSGTDDFALFQNGSTDTATIINRSGQSIFFTVGSTTVLQLDAAAAQVTLGSTGTNNIRINNTTESTVGGAGGADALPATPLGYLTVNVNGATVKIPYYND
jgi:hypothetical protein